MQLLQTPEALRAWRRQQSSPLHFVPTMGALHRGHGALIRAAARARAGEMPPVLVSVFVNPLQFGPGEDFEHYPRDLGADVERAAAAGAAALFAPEAGALFAGGVTAITRILPPDSLTQTLCGPCRPGHFEGVATVVARLLALVRPSRLWLGEKDWQQLVILRRVIADLGLPVQVEGVGTVREPDGLPCSSRNRYLCASERRQAAVLPRALEAVARLARQDPQRCDPPATLLRNLLEEQGLRVDYTQWVEAHTLQPVHRLSGLSVLAAAVHCGSARLIDHTFLMSRAPIVAIDGPAGAGKSTVTRAFARRLGLVYLDTGAMYRAVTWWLQRQGVDRSDAAAVAPQLADLQLGFQGTGSEQRVLLQGHDITEAIRSPEVTAEVSLVAAHGCVRDALTAQQQAMGTRGGLVAEGRDIGTAVFPEADLKVFLTATVAERARRRAHDLRERGFAVPAMAELEAQIAERDHRDSTRAVAPLRMAHDAVELVTDGMGIDAVIEALLDLFRAQVPHDAWPEPPEGSA
ncbi:bifunctional pantoate ligase/cytidylate kinase [Cyanobium sp. PCC 7001]|nr:bifunctional pantoate--beta-alanine ligase/(d)CMP kinase [Cyanobium sp. PCC 7001]EDY38760.1 bifunctional pantoate ligase/cytidylate kinase [Cyanobium sp. PCC 7001]